MLKLQNILCVGFLILYCVQGNAQYGVPISQFYLLPTYYNPAMAGISFGPRFVAHYRNQSPSIGSNPGDGFTTYTLGYDQHLDKIKSGIGLVIQADQVGDGLLRSYEVQGLYSFQMKLNRKTAFKLGIAPQYQLQQLNWSKLQFGDQINEIDGFSLGTATSEQQPTTLTKSAFNLGAGAFLFTEKFYWGIGSKNILPQKGFNTSIKNQLELNTQIGGVFIMQKRKNVFFSPNVLFVYRTTKQFQLTAGALLNYQYIQGGLWVKHTLQNGDAIVPSVGFNKGKIKVVYSYDAAISGLKKISGGAHEIGVAFNLAGTDNSINPRFRSGYTECPLFKIQ